VGSEASAYLERNRRSYYDALQTIHETGDAIPWIELFLAAVRTQAADAVARARGIIEAGPRPAWGLRTPSRWSS
jgi:Fic family protein